MHLVDLDATTTSDVAAAMNQSDDPSYIPSDDDVDVEHLPRYCVIETLILTGLLQKVYQHCPICSLELDSKAEISGYRLRLVSEIPR